MVHYPQPNINTKQIYYMTYNVSMCINFRHCNWTFKTPSEVRFDLKIDDRKEESFNRVLRISYQLQNKADIFMENSSWEIPIQHRWRIDGPSITC